MGFIIFEKRGRNEIFGATNIYHSTTIKIPPRNTARAHHTRSHFVSFNSPLFNPPCLPPPFPLSLKQQGFMLNAYVYIKYKSTGKRKVKIAEILFLVRNRFPPFCRLGRKRVRITAGGWRSSLLSSIHWRTRFTECDNRLLNHFRGFSVCSDSWSRGRPRRCLETLSRYELSMLDASL